MCILSRFIKFPTHLKHYITIAEDIRNHLAHTWCVYPRQTNLFSLYGSYYLWLREEQTPNIFGHQDIKNIMQFVAKDASNTGKHNLSDE